MNTVRDTELLVMLKFTIEAMFASVTLFMLLQAWGVYTRETL